MIPLTALTVRLCTNWTVGDQSATKGDRLSIALRESPVTPIRNGETIRRTRRLLGLGTDAVAVAEGFASRTRTRREDTLRDLSTSDEPEL